MPLALSTRHLLASTLLLLVACNGASSSSVDASDGFVDAAETPPDAGPPALIVGGGVGGGPLSGTLTIFVIDALTNAQLAGATITADNVELLSATDTPTAFDGPTGTATIQVTLANYSTAIWVGVSGASATIPIMPQPPTVPTTILRGEVVGWADVPVEPQHEKFGAVYMSATGDADDPYSERQLATTSSICSGSSPCTFTRASPVGDTTMVAAVLDRDTRGTGTYADDIVTVTHWATGPTVAVEEGEPQTGLELTALTPAQLQEVSVELPAAPTGLPTIGTILYAELPDNEAVQLPWAFWHRTTDSVPRPSVFGASTYRLMVTADSSPSSTRRSLSFARGLAGTTLTVPAMIDFPTFTATRSEGSWSPVAGATMYNAMWATSQGELVKFTIFDPQITNVVMPSNLELPTTGFLGFRIYATAVEFDVKNFSLPALNATTTGFSNNSSSNLN